jgi:hypothetical protein
MSFVPSFLRSRQAVLFLVGSLPCLLLALYTQHHWEDWFITFRAAKNLAAGNGLVFQPGEVLQTFTSPVNVLLPAFLSWITGNTHDELVMWLYRLVGAALLGSTVLILDRLAQREQYARPVLWFLIAFFVIDGKIADFTINGQEAAFMVFSLALMLLALMERRTLLLGVAWACLMWSRPDSFIYIGSASIGYLLALALGERDALLPTVKRFVIAGLITIVLYGPWFAWTWWYYGTPIPHTVVAKGLGTHHTLLEQLKNLLLFPVNGLLGFEPTTLGSMFMPTNFVFGGWPPALKVFSRILSLIAVMAWLFPRQSVLVRTTSLAAFVGAFYLQHVAPYAAAWYFPAPIFFTILTLSGLLHSAWQQLHHKLEHRLLAGAAALVVVVWLAVTLCMAWQVRIQQTIIESQRKDIGLWLRANARTPHDTVFLECLGYIGFYSGLKMYDYPGMSSPEVVAARAAHGEAAWGLINALSPDWVVLRPFEVIIVTNDDPSFAHRYKLAKAFDSTALVTDEKFLPGRRYLQYDQAFFIFHRTDAAK